MKRFLPVFILSLTACRMAPPQSQAVITDSQTPTIEKTRKIQHSLDNADVAAIWTNAEIARQQGEFAQAGIYIERALQITPDDPVLWSRLAELRLRLGEYPLAENYAAKSNALSAEDTSLLHRNWLIIQHSRNKRGDVSGARKAQVQVRRYAGEQAARF